MVDIHNNNLHRPGSVIRFKLTAFTAYYSGLTMPAGKRDAVKVVIKYSVQMGDYLTFLGTTYQDEIYRDFLIQYLSY